MSLLYTGDPILEAPIDEDEPSPEVVVFVPDACDGCHQVANAATL